MRAYTTMTNSKSRTGFLASTALLVTALTALGFPPAPYHTFYGMVRDDMGNPLMSSTAEVKLITGPGSQISVPIVPGLSPGMNYRLQVPMDAGLTPANYSPTALRPYVSFSMKVVENGITYLPMELEANFSNLGKPTESTRIDITLGVDSDNDGLPDAWEDLVIAMGFGQTLADILPNADSDGDGLSNLNEYLAGTYAFDAEDGFSLNLTGIKDGKPQLDFMVISGRSYTVMSSDDLKTWTKVNFRAVEEGVPGEIMENYNATDVRILQISAEVPAERKTLFFKAKVQ
jgi:hypothetical protein